MEKNRFRRIISLFLVAVLIVSAVSAGGNTQSSRTVILGDSERSAELGASLGTSLGSSGEEYPEDLRFVIVSSTAFLGDKNFDLLKNMEVYNSDGTPNTTFVVQDNGGFDIHTQGEYSVKYRAVDAVTGEEGIAGFIIRVQSEVDFSPIPQRKLQNEDIDRNNLPCWEDSFPVEFLPFGWEFLQEIAPVSGVSYWTLIATEYDDLPSEMMTRAQLEEKEWRWQEQFDVSLLPLGYKLIFEQDEITGAQYWTAVPMMSLLNNGIEVFTFTSNFAQARYPTFKEDGALPAELTLTIKVDTSKTELAGGRIELTFDPEKGYRNTPYFSYLKHSNLPSFSVFQSVTVTGNNLTLQLKDDFEGLSATDIQISYLYNIADYDGTVPADTVLANTKAVYYLGDAPVQEIKHPQIQSFNSYGMGEVTNTSSPTSAHTTIETYKHYVVDIWEGQSIQVHNYLRYRYIHRRKPDPAYVATVKVYAPVGTTVTAGSITFDKGPNNQGIFVPAGTVKNVPEGHYYISTTPLGKMEDWDALSEATRMFQRYVGYKLPPLGGGTDYVYTTLDAKYLGDDTILQETMKIEVKETITGKWDFHTTTLHRPGFNSFQPICGLNTGDVSYKVSSNSDIYTGFPFTNTTSNKNIGTVPITGYRLTLAHEADWQDILENQPNTAPSADGERINFDRIFIQASRDSNDNPWSRVKVEVTVKNARTGALSTTSETYTFTLTSGGISSYSITLPTLGENEYIYSVVAIPLHSKTLEPGVLMPGHSITFLYGFKAWNNRTLPNGDTFADYDNYLEIPMKYHINYYNADLGKDDVHEGAQTLCYYGENITAGTADIASSDGKSHNLRPGDTAEFLIQGRNIFGKHDTAWKQPMMVVKVPGGARIDQTTAELMQDGQSKGTVTITELPSSQGNRYYRFVAPENYEAHANRTTREGVIFSIPFALNIPMTAVGGTYTMEIVNTSYNLADYNCLPDFFVKIPEGQRLSDYGLAEGTRYMYNTPNENFRFTVLTNENIRSVVRTRSEKTRGWETTAKIPGKQGGLFEMKVELINQGETPQSGFTAYGLVPYPRYLDSSLSTNVSLDSIQASGATIYYYSGTEPPLPQEILSIDPTTQPGWSTTLSAAATAYFIDFEDTVLNTNQSVVFDIDLRMEGGPDNGQDVYNQVVYTAAPVEGGGLGEKTGTILSKVGIGTYEFHLEYLVEPENLPATNIPLSIVRDFVGDSIGISLDSKIPQYGGATFVSWNTKPDGSGTTYHPGQFLVLRKSDADFESILRMKLYTQWDGPVGVEDNGTLKVPIIGQVVWDPHGAPVATVTLERMDGPQQGSVYYQQSMLPLTEVAGSIYALGQDEIVFENLPWGSYNVSVCLTDRYFPIDVTYEAVDVSDATSPMRTTVFECENHKYCTETDQKTISFLMT